MKNSRNIIFMKRSARKAFAFTAVLLALVAFSIGARAADPVAADDAPVRLTASVDVSTITVGDPIRYTISAVYEKGYHLEFMSPGTNLGAFEIRDYERKDPIQLNDGREEIIQEYVISTYDTGKFDIPPFSVGYWKRETEKDVLETDKIEITVKSISGKNAKDIQDIKDPIAVRASYLKYFIAGGGALLLIVLAVLLIVFLRKRSLRRKLDGPPAPRRVEAPDVIALRELDAIEAKNLPAEGRIKEFYVGISEVARKYISGRYGIVTMERTTDEIMSDLLYASVNADHAKLIGTLLRDADMVKFAKMRPTPETCRDDVKRARVIIETTREGAAPIAVSA